MIFIFAAGTKGMDLIGFQRQIEFLFESWHLDSTGIGTIVAAGNAVGVIAVEFVLGAMLIVGYRVRTAVIGSIVLLVGFGLVVGWEVLSGSSSDCGCFGTLIQRSPQAALIEDIIMLGLATIGMASSATDKPKRGRWAGILVASGLIWTLFFVVVPLPGGALRSGMDWHPAVPNDPEQYPEEYLLWVFDPDCNSCHGQIGSLNRLAGQGLRIIGLTDATVGGIQEFIWDFEPSFEIQSIGSDRLKRMKLLPGSTILIKQKKVQHIWRPGQLPTTIMEIIER